MRSTAGEAVTVQIRKSKAALFLCSPLLSYSIFSQSPSENAFSPLWCETQKLISCINIHLTTLELFQQGLEREQRKRGLLCDNELSPMFFLFMGNSSNKKQVFHLMLLKAISEFYNKVSTEFRTEFVGQMQANLLEKNTAKHISREES